jgi:hypothetical protein
MPKFVAKHAALTTGTLSCFDRLLFTGHLSLGYPHGMEDFLHHQGVLFQQLTPFVLRQAERLRTPSHALAEKAGRPWQYCESPVRTDERARDIAHRDGITEGLVCVFATVEPCRSFRLAYGQGRPAIRPAWRKCLFLYFYFLDRQFGLLHVRLQTWFPLTIQGYLNGHDWLARQLDQRGLRSRRLDNAFLWLEDPARAQRLADRFANLPWPIILERLARRVALLLIGKHGRRACDLKTTCGDRRCVEATHILVVRPACPHPRRDRPNLDARTKDAIYRMRHSGATIGTVARAFGVGHSTVSAIAGPLRRREVAACKFARMVCRGAN